jgi:hypothetical protein
VISRFRGVRVSCFRVFVAVVISTTSAAAQREAKPPTGNPPPAPPSGRAEIVEVVGCLREEPPGAWLVTNATEPVISKMPFTNQATLKEAEAKALGKERFALIGVSMFTPASLTGRKVAVKGLLIEDPKLRRLNVTSLQGVGDACK